MPYPFRVDSATAAAPGETLDPVIGQWRCSCVVSLLGGIVLGVGHRQEGLVDDGGVGVGASVATTKGVCDVRVGQWLP